MESTAPDRVNGKTEGGKRNSGKTGLNLGSTLRESVTSTDSYGTEVIT